MDFLNNIDQNTPINAVTPNNWTYCRYRLGPKIGLVTFGAEPMEEDETPLEGIKEFYYVTVITEDMEEVFQKRFSHLEHACLYLNQHYSHWDFEDQSVASAGGCGSCQNNH